LLPAEILDWNRTEAEYPREKTISQLFEDQAARTPEDIAVISANVRLSYRELQNRVNRLAGYLQSQGVGPDVIAAVAIERSHKMLIAMLAILEAGGAYLPIDPGYPRDRIAFVLADSEAPLLLTTEDVRKRLPTTAAKIISMDDDRAAISGDSSVSTTSPATGKNLAYVIYTSGSTGKPKGVMVEHRNVVNFFTGMDRAIGTDRGVWLAVTSVSFDISALELLWTLTRGFTVVIHGKEGTHTIAREIETHHVTHLQSTPSLARMLATDPRSLASLASIQKLLLGGEALPASLITQLRDVVRGEIFNMYGPTETTIWSTTYRIEGNPTTIPIGKPIANTQVYVLNPAFEPVPVGEAGELFIGGEGVVRGYWKRPELTAERFLADPFHREGRIYRTGDVARFMPDGNLEFLGRVDFQVKLRGFRIELGEIEATLEQMPSIRQAVVVAREDKPGDMRLVAYVVAKTNESATPASLRAALTSKLPEYMVPSHFVFLDRLPLTSNGKIDRKALPPVSVSGAGAGGVDDDPHSEIERVIAGAWAHALGVDRVSRNDNFFDLGAHSLMVPEVHIQIQEALGREISLVDLFQFPTVNALATHLGGAKTARPGSDRAQRRIAARQPRGRS
jgi:amino acid adenylation domain-containing protein